MEDRKTKIQSIKEKEKDFINRLEALIRDKFKNELFRKYKNTIKSISLCYADKQMSLIDARACSENLRNSYLKAEDRFEAIMKHYDVRL